MYDKQHFTRDAGTVTFHSDSDGVTRDDDGDVTVDWDEVEQVTIDNAPHADAFETRDFYRLRATVARPIPQPYEFNDELVWLKKPRAELKRAAWSLDNKPWTLGHPDTGMVADVDDIRGFWNDTAYFDATDDLDSYLHVPVNDDEAQEFIEDTGDVSIGFRNRIARPDDYDGIVGGDDAGDVELDGYQTHIFCDHCASVHTGRCPADAGCGINGGAMDSQPTGTMTQIDTDTTITNRNEDAVTGDEQTSVLSEEAQTSHTHEESWYAVPPADNPDDEWKFPIDNCSDVSDAWHFAIRERGDISIEFSTLKRRIKERARQLDCDVPEESDDAMDVSLDAIDYQITESMTDDCGCDGNGDSMGISFDDLSPSVALDKLATEYDELDEHLTDLRTKAEAADEAADELDVAPDKVADTASMLSEQNDELRAQVDELQRPKLEDAAEFIADRTDRYGDDTDEIIENHDGLDDLLETKELVDELTTQTDNKTANTNASTDGESGGNGVETDRHGYVNFE